MSEKKPKTFKQKIVYWLFPETNEKIDIEINENNIKSIRYLCLVISVIQLISLIVFILLHLGKPFNNDSFTSAFHVFLSIIICLAIFVFTTIILKKKVSFIQNNGITNVLMVIMMTLILLWSEYVSIKHYVSNCQMMTFFTAELCVALFLKLRPIINISIITLSSAGFYIYLSFFVKGEPINPYNYAMFFAILLASAVQSYRYTASNIKQRNQINMLNKNLQIIANHDITTRLRNRYSLGYKIGESVDRKICLAMVDINTFKSINDTYGHIFGDDVLKLVADNMIKIFSKDNVFRYGGDEFLVVEEGCDIEQFKNKFKLLNEKLKNNRINNTDITISCSSGCVQASINEPQDFLKLISLADDKLYTEKHKNV